MRRVLYRVGWICMMIMLGVLGFLAGNRATAQWPQATQKMGLHSTNDRGPTAPDDRSRRQRFLHDLGRAFCAIDSAEDVPPPSDAPPLLCCR